MFGSPEPEQHRELEKTVIRPVSWHPSASRAISGFETANRPTSEIPAVPNVYMDSNTSWEPSYTAYMNDNASRHMSQEGSTDLETAIMNYFAGVSTYPLEVQFDSSMDSEVSQHMNVTENWLSAQHAQMQQAWSHTPVDPSEATELHNDFLPIQATQGGKQPSLRSQRSKDSAKSLIGMGLYDPPEDPVRTWQTQYDGYRSWLAPDLVPSSGKGLKLEETFEPPPDHDEDCEEDNGSSEDEVQEEPPSLDDPQLHVTVASSQPTNLAGQSFFFEDDEAYHNDWWYSQGKNPSAQDAVMDCNWI
ncbi:MAG: hypothetical protein M1820_003303 [Bogoriella megaspora]|nr:MAG: hypothetical protein M1820_003303 [Bogoriella megaspora]